MDNFSWGDSLEETIFNGNKIIKYHPFEVEGCTVTKRINHALTSYHVPDLSESFPTYNLAVIGIMVRQNLGINNSGITYAIGRILEEAFK